MSRRAVISLPRSSPRGRQSEDPEKLLAAQEELMRIVEKEEMESIAAGPQYALVASVFSSEGVLKSGKSSQQSGVSFSVVDKRTFKPGERRAGGKDNSGGQFTSYSRNFLVEDLPSGVSQQDAEKLRSLYEKNHTVVPGGVVLKEGVTRPTFEPIDFKRRALEKAPGIIVKEGETIFELKSLGDTIQKRIIDISEKGLKVKESETITRDAARSYLSKLLPKSSRVLLEHRDEAAPRKFTESGIALARPSDLPGLLQSESGLVIVPAVGTKIREEKKFQVRLPTASSAQPEELREFTMPELDFELEQSAKAYNEILGRFETDPSTGRARTLNILGMRLNTLVGERERLRSGNLKTPEEGSFVSSVLQYSGTPGTTKVSLPSGALTQVSIGLNSNAFLSQPLSTFTDTTGRKVQTNIDLSSNRNNRPLSQEELYSLEFQARRDLLMSGLSRVEVDEIPRDVLLSRYGVAVTPRIPLEVKSAEAASRRKEGDIYYRAPRTRAEERFFAEQGIEVRSGRDFRTDESGQPVFRLANQEERLEETRNIIDASGLNALQKGQAKQVLDKLASGKELTDFEKNFMADFPPDLLAPLTAPPAGLVARYDEAGNLLGRSVKEGPRPAALTELLHSGLLKESTGEALSAAERKAIADYFPQGFKFLDKQSEGKIRGGDFTGFRDVGIVSVSDGRVNIISKAGVPGVSDIMPERGRTPGVLDYVRPEDLAASRNKGLQDLVTKGAPKGAISRKSEIVLPSTIGEEAPVSLLSPAKFDQVAEGKEGLLSPEDFLDSINNAALKAEAERRLGLGEELSLITDLVGQQFIGSSAEITKKQQEIRSDILADVSRSFNVTGEEAARIVDTRRTPVLNAGGQPRRTKAGKLILLSAETGAILDQRFANIMQAMVKEQEKFITGLPTPRLQEKARSLIQGGETIKTATIKDEAGRHQIFLLGPQITEAQVGRARKVVNIKTRLDIFKPDLFAKQPGEFRESIEGIAAAQGLPVSEVLKKFESETRGYAKAGKLGPSQVLANLGKDISDPAAVRLIATDSMLKIVGGKEALAFEREGIKAERQRKLFESGPVRIPLERRPFDKAFVDLYEGKNLAAIGLPDVKGTVAKVVGPTLGGLAVFGGELGAAAAPFAEATYRTGYGLARSLVLLTKGDDIYARTVLEKTGNEVGAVGLNLAASGGYLLGKGLEYLGHPETKIGGRLLKEASEKEILRTEQVLGERRFGEPVTAIGEFLGDEKSKEFFVAHPEARYISLAGGITLLSLGAPGKLGQVGRGLGVVSRIVSRGVVAKVTLTKAEREAQRLAGKFGGKVVGMEQFIPKIEKGQTAAGIIKGERATTLDELVNELRISRTAEGKIPKVPEIEQTLDPLSGLGVGVAKDFSPRGLGIVPEGTAPARPLLDVTGKTPQDRVQRFLDLYQKRNVSYDVLQEAISRESIAARSTMELKAIQSAISKSFLGTPQVGQTTRAGRIPRRLADVRLLESKEAAARRGLSGLVEDIGFSAELKAGAYDFAAPIKTIPVEEATGFSRILTKTPITREEASGLLKLVASSKEFRKAKTGVLDEFIKSSVFGDLGAGLARGLSGRRAIVPLKAGSDYLKRFNIFKPKRSGSFISLEGKPISKTRPRTIFEELATGERSERAQFLTQEGKLAQLTRGEIIGLIEKGRAGRGAPISYGKLRSTDLDKLLGSLIRGGEVKETDLGSLLRGRGGIPKPSDFAEGVGPIYLFKQVRKGKGRTLVEFKPTGKVPDVLGGGLTPFQRTGKGVVTILREQAKQLPKAGTYGDLIGLPKGRKVRGRFTQRDMVEPKSFFDLSPTSLLGVAGLQGIIGTSRFEEVRRQRKRSEAQAKAEQRKRYMTTERLTSQALLQELAPDEGAVSAYGGLTSIEQFIFARKPSGALREIKGPKAVGAIADYNKFITDNVFVRKPAGRQDLVFLNDIVDLGFGTRTFTEDVPRSLPKLLSGREFVFDRILETPGKRGEIPGIRDLLFPGISFTTDVVPTYTVGQVPRQDLGYKFPDYTSLIYGEPEIGRPGRVPETPRVPKTTRTRIPPLFGFPRPSGGGGGYYFPRGSQSFDILRKVKLLSIAGEDPLGELGGGDEMLARLDSLTNLGSNVGIKLFGGKKKRKYFF